MTPPAARRLLFLHQDGLAIVTAVGVLNATGHLDHLASGKPRQPESGAGPGVVAASCRVLVNAGWLAPVARVPGAAELTPRGLAHLLLRDLYLEAGATLAQALHVSGGTSDASLIAEIDPVAGNLARLAAGASSSHRDSREGEEAATSILGALATVAVPRLGTPDRIGAKGDGGAVLSALGWADDQGELTALGQRMHPHRPHYAIVGSYARSLLRLPEQAREGQVTPSVFNAGLDRVMNVVGSGASHRAYFQAAGSIIAALFDGAPVHRQPRAIVDVGCGDGTWLRQIHHFVETSTHRGQHLRQEPLVLVGVDVDPVALDCAAAKMTGFDAHFISGEIGDPIGLMDSVGEATGFEPDECLHLRAFVDHNRVTTLSGDCDSGADLRSPVRLDHGGAAVEASDVCDEWRDYVGRWGKVLGAPGLVMIEAHPYATGEPPLESGSNIRLAFEYYHALSGQCPVAADELSTAVDSNRLAQRVVASFPKHQDAITVRHVQPRGRHEHPMSVPADLTPKSPTERGRATEMVATSKGDEEGGAVSLIGAPPRVGHIDFLNCYPLLWGLDKLGVLGQIELTRATPDILSDALTAGALDISPISVVELLRHADDLVVLPDIAIGSDGPVMSCLIISRVPLHQLHGARVALSSTSRTSVRLAQLLLGRRVGIRAKYFFCEPDFDVMLTQADAAVVIGDMALNAALHAASRLNLEVHDLGAMWRDWTGLPFVFAVFAARRDFLNREPEKVRRVHEHLLEARTAGLAHLDQVCEAASSDTVHTATLKRYYTEALDFTLGERQLVGIAEFARRTGGRCAGFSRDVRVRVLEP